MDKKFIETIDIENFEILTDTGFVDVVKLHKTVPYNVYELKTKSGLTLKCADTHKMFRPDYSEVYLIDLKPNDQILTVYLDTLIIIDTIESIVNLEYIDNMFDFELIEGSNHRYLTNGILSHNTETAKVIAEEIFGPNSLIRIDMSEYQERHTVSKLIGAPPGYVGYGEGGDLTEKVRRKPFSVVLFDEIEKAHPDVFNTLLQVLDEGFLTDRQGRKVNFRNTIIIMTSNIGIKKAMNFASGVGYKASFSENRAESTKKIINHELREKFPPEFINRIQEIITFNPLSEEAIKTIIKIHLQKLSNRIKLAGYHFEWNENVIDFIFKDSYEPEFGARPVERAIQSLVEDEISEALLKFEALDGCLISASFSEDEKKIVVEIKNPESIPTITD